MADFKGLDETTAKDSAALKEQSKNKLIFESVQAEAQKDVKLALSAKHGKPAGQEGEADIEKLIE